ncbi:MAG: hypothetical protein ABSH50_04225 [Bryobacteraceae bacterium]|jgi:hypothetical protein
MAQTDVLGAHNVYGRGCVACHAPHSGANGGNGVGTTTDPGTGNIALWGQNLTPLYGQTIAFGDAGKYSVTLPSSISGFTGASDPNFVVIACLSCHDGNLAKVGMMKGQTVETLPIVGGHAPTLLGNDGSTAGDYNNDHPVGPSATFGCGGTYNWDCTINANGQVQMTGPASSQFVNVNYGFTVSLATYTPTGGTPVPIVTCTSCHDQHSEIVWNGKIGGTQAYWNTSFFIRGPYTPTSGGTTVSNAAAQFCRNCHGGESNEMHDLMNVPTSGVSNIGTTLIP